MTKTIEQPILGFYRPHKRVTYDGTITDPWTGVVTTPERRVKQSFVAECDINNIIKSFSVTGQFNHLSRNAQKGVYMDLPDEQDFQVSMNIIAEATQAFATLPSQVRDRFNNDPAKFLGFMSDPANQDEAIKLGLATKRSAPTADSPPPPIRPADNLSPPPEPPKK